MLGRKRKTAPCFQKCALKKRINLSDLTFYFIRDPLVALQERKDKLKKSCTVLRDDSK